MNIEEIQKALKEDQVSDKMGRRAKDKVVIEGMEIEPVPMPKRILEEEKTFDRPKPKGRLLPLKKGGSIKSASARADGIAKRGKTKGRYI